MKTIVLGSDHAGVTLKEQIKSYLRKATVCTLQALLILILDF